jgi:hypothetical protein
MFTRFVQYEIKPEKKNEFIALTKNEILPILKKQTGFNELLPFFAESKDDKRVFAISFWNSKADAQRYEREWYPKIYELMKPYLASPAVKTEYFNLETSLATHFVQTVAA